MFGLGLIFAALWAGADLLGRKIERERAEAWAAWRSEQRLRPARLRRMTDAQRSLVLVKPDGVRRGLVGEVMRRIEAKGYTLVALELRTATPELLADHYAEHEGKPFYGPLVEFMLSGPVAADRDRGRALHRGLPLAGRCHRPDGGRSRARSAATSAATGAWRSSRTSCTAPTPRSPPPARSGSGSPT